MEVLSILGIIFGGGVGSFITWAYHLKADKKIKDAEVKIQEKTAESLDTSHTKDKFESMYVQITKMMQDYNDLSDDYRTYRQGALVKERTF